ncbi:hypothetical protein VKT23_010929 [Stygiomarasmius scandens]|uniref:Uncharacterized protein n=1 Tax=Marasmiellus scandens TaxID=2682957 RepID=A0ABR1JBH2_9AGAR
MGLMLFWMRRRKQKHTRRFISPGDTVLKTNRDQPLSESQRISPTTQGTISPFTLTDPTDGGANVREKHSMILPSRIRDSRGSAVTQWRDNHVSEIQVQLGRNTQEYGFESEDMKGDEELISPPPSYVSASR